MDSLGQLPLGHAVQGAEFVACRVAQIGQIQLSQRTLAHSGRILAVGATVGDARRVPGICRLG